MKYIIMIVLAVLSIEGSAWACNPSQVIGTFSDSSSISEVGCGNAAIYLAEIMNNPPQLTWGFSDVAACALYSEDANGNVSLAGPGPVQSSGGTGGLFGLQYILACYNNDDGTRFGAIVGECDQTNLCYQSSPGIWE